MRFGRSRIWSSTLTPAEAVHWGGRRELNHIAAEVDNNTLGRPQTPSYAQVRGGVLLGLGFLATVIGFFCYSGLVRGFFATVLPGEGFLRQFHGGFLRRCRLAGGFLQQSHGGFLRRCRLAGGFLHQSHGGFLHQFSRPDKATLKQQKLQLENFGFSVFPHIPRRIKKLVLVAVVLLP